MSRPDGGRPGTALVKPIPPLCLIEKTGTRMRSPSVQGPAGFIVRPHESKAYQLPPLAGFVLVGSTVWVPPAPAFLSPLQAVAHPVIVRPAPAIKPAMLRPATNFLKSFFSMAHTSITVCSRCWVCCELKTRLPPRSTISHCRRNRKRPFVFDQDIEGALQSQGASIPGLSEPALRAVESRIVPVRPARPPFIGGSLLDSASPWLRSP